MRLMKRFIGSTIFLTILSVGMIACGGGDDTPAATDNTTTNATTTPTTGGTTTTTDTTSTSSSTPTDTTTTTTATDTTTTTTTGTDTASTDTSSTGTSGTGTDTGTGTGTGTDTGTGTGTADTTPPTVTSIKTNTSQSLSAKSTLVTTASTFLVTFSETIADDLTALALKITLTCGKIGQPITLASVTDTDGITDNELSVTPNAALPAGTDCALTVAAGIADSAGNASAADTFAAISTCGLTDDFNDPTSLSVCWTTGTDNKGVLTANVADGLATFGIPADVSTINADGSIKNVAFTKTIQGDFVVNTVLKNISGLNNPFGQSGADGIALIATASATGSTVACGPLGNGGAGVSVYFFAAGGADAPATSDPIGSGTGIDLLLVRLTKTGSTFTCEYSTDGGTFTTVGSALTVSDFDGVTSAGSGIFFIHSGSQAISAVADKIIFVQ